MVNTVRCGSVLAVILATVGLQPTQVMVNFEIRVGPNNREPENRDQQRVVLPSSIEKLRNTNHPETLSPDWTQMSEHLY